MKRRDFLKSSAMLASAGALVSNLRGQDQPQAAAGGEYYELREYHLRMGPKQRIVEDYWRKAGVPAWNRAGIANVGVFNVMVGPDSPTLYVLLPCASFAALEAAKEKVLADEAHQRDGAEYIDAAATDPDFVRIESTFLKAFAGMPKIEVPERKARVFELRTYESPTEKAGRKKVEMFNNGEIPIFRRAGLAPVFFGEALIGSRLPRLTYMVVFPDLTARTKNWANFGADPDWKRLSGMPEYADIVSNITNIFLQPAGYSQI